MCVVGLCSITKIFYSVFCSSALCFILHSFPRSISFFMSVFFCVYLSTLCYISYCIQWFIPCVDKYFIPHYILYFTVTDTPTTTVTTTAAVKWFCSWLTLKLKRGFLAYSSCFVLCNSFLNFVLGFVLDLMHNLPVFYSSHPTFCSIFHLYVALCVLKYNVICFIFYSIVYCVL